MSLGKINLVDYSSPQTPDGFNYIIARIFRILDGFELTDNVSEFLTSYTATKEEKIYSGFCFGFTPIYFVKHIVEHPEFLSVKQSKDSSDFIVEFFSDYYYLSFQFEKTDDIQEFEKYEDVAETLKDFILEMFNIASVIGTSSVGISCLLKTVFNYEKVIQEHSLKELRKEFFTELKKTNRFLYNFLRGAVILGFEVHDSKLGGDRFMIGLSNDDFSDSVFLDDPGNKKIIIEILNKIFGEKKVRDINFIPHLDAKSQKQMLEGE